MPLLIEHTKIEHPRLHIQRPTLTRHGRPRRAGEGPSITSGPDRSILPASILTQGCALAILLGLHGSVPWRAFRVACVAGATALVISISRSRRPASGWAAVLFGIAGSVVGVGIGVRWVQKAGLTFVGIIGLMILGTGLTLIVKGTATLMRAVRGWHRVIALPIGMALIAFVLLPLSLALMATNVPPTALGSATPADRGLAYSDVTFATSDGVLLSGWYIPSKNRAAVVLTHGAGSTRSGVLSHAVALARRGFGVLLFDARGHGKSAGRGMDFGWYGDADIAGAVTYLTERSDVDPLRIAAVGMSMGGEEAIGAAASDRRLQAVVAEGVTHRVYADDTEWLPRGVDGFIQRGINKVLYGAMDLTTSASPPIGLRSALIATAPRPVMIIAAGLVRDEQLAAQAFSRGLENTETWIVPESGHTGGLSTQPEAWTMRVSDFLDRALGTS